MEIDILPCGKTIDLHNFSFPLYECSMVYLTNQILGSFRLCLFVCLLHFQVKLVDEVYGLCSSLPDPLKNYSEGIFFF